MSSTTTFQQQTNFFKGLIDAIRKKANKQISSELNALKHRLVSASPVLHGVYKKSWSVSKKRSNMMPNLITGAGIALTNKTDYEEPIEHGVAPTSMHPWAISYRNGSSGLVMSQGRVWSRKAIGGVVGTVFDDAERKRVANKLARDLVRLIK